MAPLPPNWMSQSQDDTQRTEDFMERNRRRPSKLSLKKKNREKENLEPNAKRNKMAEAEEREGSDLDLDDVSASEELEEESASEESFDAEEEEDESDEDEDDDDEGSVSGSEEESQERLSYGQRRKERARHSSQTHSSVSPGAPKPAPRRKAKAPKPATAAKEGGEQKENIVWGSFRSKSTSSAMSGEASKVVGRPKQPPIPTASDLAAASSGEKGEEGPSSAERENTKTSTSFEEDDPNEDVCGECGLENGELVCCDRCPKAYHASCIGLEEIPEGEWLCPKCVGKGKGGKMAAPVVEESDSEGAEEEEEEEEYKADEDEDEDEEPVLTQEQLSEQRAANVAALAGNMEIRVVRRPLMPSILTVKGAEAVLRAPFKSPCGANHSNDLKRRLFMRKRFVPWGSKGLPPLPTSSQDTGESEEEGGEPLVLWQSKAPREMSESDEGDADFVPAETVEVAKMLTKWLRPHQREGVQFMFECVCGLKDFEGNGCILADDMGLGKTLQGLTLLWTLLKQGSEVRPEGWNKKHTSFFLTDSLSLSHSSGAGREARREEGRHRVPHIAGGQLGLRVRQVAQGKGQGVCSGRVQSRRRHHADRPVPLPQEAVRRPHRVVRDLQETHQEVP